MQKLLDFDMVIEAHDDGYRTHVVASPAGEAHADFTLPFSDEGLENLVLKVVGSIGRARRQVRRIETQERQLLEDFGGQLFEAVFCGPVGECLERSRMTAENKEAGLRIRLRLPGALANVPWEYLYDAQHGFLGLDPETALVRHLELPAPVRPFPISPPLRILAMISAPSDTVGLEVEQEWDRLNDTLGDLTRRGLVTVDRLESGNLAALQRPLRLTEYHVLHFIGHGGYDENAQDGALALEDADGKTRLVTGRDLGMMIRNRRHSLRLVVLNACEGARSAQDDPFGGVAQALVHQGIPAVIAMQFEISDTAAITFSQSFYQAIADGLPVDVATVEARRAMFAEGNEIEWATPVLYLRSTDGRVFIRGRGSAAERQAKEAAERQAQEEAERQARLEAERQARLEAERQAQLDAERQAQLEAERQAQEQAARQAQEQAARQARIKAGPRAKIETDHRARVPVLAASPIGLGHPSADLGVESPYRRHPHFQTIGNANPLECYSRLRRGRSRVQSPQNSGLDRTYGVYLCLVSALCDIPAESLAPPSPWTLPASPGNSGRDRGDIQRLIVDIDTCQVHAGKTRCASAPACPLGLYGARVRCCSNCLRRRALLQSYSPPR